MRLVGGIGINDADYGVTFNVDGKQVWICPYYSRWKSLLSRVRKDRYYEDSEVCDFWKSFMNFREWLAPRLFYPDLHIDKDMLVKGNTLYSPETCILVPQRINKLFLTYKESTYPLGVSYQDPSSDMKNPLRNPYRATVHNGVKRVSLGMFSDPFSAHQAWQKGKIKALQESIVWWASGDYSLSFNEAGRDALDARAQLISDDLAAKRVTLEI